MPRVPRVSLLPLRKPSRTPVNSTLARVAAGGAATLPSARRPETYRAMSRPGSVLRLFTITADRTGSVGMPISATEATVWLCSLLSDTWLRVELVETTPCAPPSSTEVRTLLRSSPSLASSTLELPPAIRALTMS